MVAKYTTYPCNTAEELWENLNPLNEQNYPETSKYIFLSSKFQGFGNRAIVIAGYNITEFEKRLKIAITSNPNILLHKNHQIIGKQISYLNRCNYHGEMNIFNKFDEYSWQNEFRIGFKLKNKTDTYKLKLGNLSDIVYEFKTEDLINNPIKLTRSHRPRWVCI